MALGFIVAAGLSRWPEERTIVARSRTATHLPRAARLEFRVLGPIEAIRLGFRLSLGGPKQCAVLAMLLLDAGRVIPSDRLAEELWRSRPPPGAAKIEREPVCALATLEESTAAGSTISKCLDTYITRGL